MRDYWREIAGALITLIVQIATMPRTPWENDEFLFALAVKKFEPTIWAYHPSANCSSPCARPGAIPDEHGAAAS